MTKYICQININEATGLPVYIMKDIKDKKGGRMIRLNTMELDKFFRHLNAINQALNGLQLANKETMDYVLYLSRTKRFQITKRKNKVMCGFCRPSILNNGNKHGVHLLVSATKWKLLDNYFKGYIISKLMNYN